MSRTLEFLAFLLLMILYIILPCAVFWTRNSESKLPDQLTIRCQDAWWNRPAILGFAYMTWLVTPLSIASIGISMFVHAEFSAHAVLTKFAELAKEHPLLSLAWEGVIALACSVIFLQVMESRINRSHRLRVWSIEHSAGGLVIMAMFLFVAQAVLINWGG